jgi:hypothetical protein
MSLATLLEEATRVQIKFANREDPELQALRRDKWGAVAKELERIIDERSKQQSTLSRKNR